jgi:hypothetical protein
MAVLASKVINKGLCKERKPKRPNPEATETGNDRNRKFPPNFPHKIA